MIKPAGKFTATFKWTGNSLQISAITFCAVDIYCVLAVCRHQVLLECIILYYGTERSGMLYLTKRKNNKQLTRETEHFGPVGWKKMTWGQF